MAAERTNAATADANRSPEPPKPTVMPIQSIAEENRMFGRYARNVRRSGSPICPRAIRFRLQAVVSGSLPVAAGVPSARPLEELV